MGRLPLAAAGGVALALSMGGQALAQPIWLTCYADIPDQRQVYISGAIPAQVSGVRKDGGRWFTDDSRAYDAQESFNQYVEAKLGRGIFGAECEIFLSPKAAVAAAAKLRGRWTNTRLIETRWTGAQASIN